MIRISDKKGFVLALAIYFVILAVITSIGLYTYSGYIVREAGIAKEVSVRGYYCAVAGVRYASILLKNPTTNLKKGSPYVTSGEITTLAFNGETVTLTINQGSSLGQDLLLSGNDSLIVTITEYNTGAPWAPNSYQVIADFNS